MKRERLIILWLLLLLAIIGIKSLINSINIQNQLKEQNKVQQYVECLENNNMQRDFCARKQESSYYYMDNLIKKYGYTYIQENKDLKIVKVGN